MYLSQQKNLFQDDKQSTILAGGKGTRISEESKVKPKPMVLIARTQQLNTL